MPYKLSPHTGTEAVLDTNCTGIGTHTPPQRIRRSEAAADTPPKKPTSSSGAAIRDAV